jgi:5-methylcytosine-specific restriction endonuclease McrA
MVKKGESLTEETKQKLREKALQRIKEGRTNPADIGNKTRFKKGNISWNTGIKMSDETRQKMRLAKLKNPTRYWLGKKRENMTGEKNNRYVGFLDAKYERKIPISEWNKIRIKVFERDGYTCQKCGKTKNEVNRLDVHHILPIKAKGDDSMENLITLCRGCHISEEIKTIKKIKEMMKRVIQIRR